MSVKTIIAKQVAAKTVHRNCDTGLFPKTFQIDGDLAANTIPVSYVGIDGSALTPAYDSFGAVLEFSLTNPAITITSPCKIAIVKGVTANAVGLQLVEKG